MKIKWYGMKCIIVFNGHCWKCTLTKHELSNLPYRIVLLRGWADQHDLRLLWGIFAEPCTGKNIFQNTLIKKHLGLIIRNTKPQRGLMFNVAYQNDRKQEVLTLNCTFESIKNGRKSDLFDFGIWKCINLFKIDSITIIALSLPVTNYIFPMKCCYSSNYEWKQ